MLMFHLMLVLPFLVMYVVAISIILFSITAIVGAFVGGTSVAILIKNKIVKKLLFIGFCILFLVGLLCLSPFIIAFASLPTVFFTIASIFIYIAIIVLSVAGIKISNSINNKIAKTILLIIFYIMLIAAISLLIFTAFASYYLLKL